MTSASARTKPVEQWAAKVEPWQYAAANALYQWSDYAHHWGHGPEMTEAAFDEAIRKAMALKVG